MAKFDMTQVITNLDGTPIPELDEAATRFARQDVPGAPDIYKDLTLGSLCCNALLINTNSNTAISGLEKIAAYKLAKKIHATLQPKGSGGVDIDSDQLLRLTQLIQDNFTIVVVGQALEMLELPTPQAVI